VTSLPTPVAPGLRHSRQPQSVTQSSARRAHSDRNGAPAKNFEARCRNPAAAFEVQVETLRKEALLSTYAMSECTSAARITRSLLGYGVLAGPLYVGVSLAQALTRDGFDLSRHAWSLLANGDLGWIQITNFIVAGSATVAAAVGLRRALGRRPAPALIAVYGASLIAAGIFRADPAQGFPVGTPEMTSVSWHGTAHFVVGGIGFLCLIAACFVLANGFSREGQRRLAWFSRVTGVVFLAGFAGIASGSHGPTTLAFVVAVGFVWAWLATVCVHLYRALADAAA
jgi:hypothetical protein